MDKREKVIKGLRHCYSAAVKWCQASVKGECNYGGQGHCRMELMKDALALLEAEEPRVVTLEEVPGTGWRISCRESPEGRYGVDAVPVVRCKDCKDFKTGYLNHDGMCLCFGDFMDNDDYCSLGERRDGDA